jgi:outer membrane protein OmpA-like peptidoglycan-associated protein
MTGVAAVVAIVIAAIAAAVGFYVGRRIQAEHGADRKRPADRPIERHIFPVLMLLAMCGAVAMLVYLFRPAPTPATLILMPSKQAGFSEEILPSDTLFARGDDQISEKGKKELDRRFSETGKEPFEVIVIGHADVRGEGHYDNKGLSTRRANAVADYIRPKFPGSVFHPFGAGSSYPLSHGCAPSAGDTAYDKCLAVDRRVEVWTRPRSEKTGNTGLEDDDNPNRMQASPIE